MKKYNYSINGGFYTNFDFGEVEAETPEEAIEKAYLEMQGLCVMINNLINLTLGLSLDIDKNWIEIKEI